LGGGNNGKCNNKKGKNKRKGKQVNKYWGPVGYRSELFFLEFILNIKKGVFYLGVRNWGLFQN
jgi:hypothetical protein